MEHITVHFMAKVPGQGRAKTRLYKALPGQLVEKLYLGMVGQMKHLAREIITQGGTCIWWWDGREPFVLPTDQGTGIHQKQHGGSLGERLEFASSGRQGLQVFLGMDCPLFSLDHLKRGRSMWSSGESIGQAMLWPAEDGGFVALMSPALPAGSLEKVPWGTEMACFAVQSALLSHGWVVKSSPQTLWDVDRMEDVHRLVEVSRGEDGRVVFCPALENAIESIRDYLA